ncbi:hypothetical protein FOZ60_016624 [Perkinsus olseni]|uniref:Amino acid transporter transmembrane domain-containing protein n=1 Tax=Perkinsus olseni TaxID=32597 RepID=A0A7J6PL27_PEROL|nr:hypothetical protein FOZ60_016624 [Perkinsus olseni]
MPMRQPSGTLDSIKGELAASGGQSNISAVANITLTGIGVGILSLPRAIAEAGYAFGFALLIFSGIVGMLYTQLLRACMKPDTRSYEDIGMDAFGRWGVAAVAFGVNGALLGTCCLLMLLLGQNSYKLYNGIAQEYWVLIWAGILLPISWLPNMKHIGYISGTVGVASVVVLLLSLIYAGFARVADNNTQHDAVYRPYPPSALGLGMSFASMTLAFAVTCASTTVLHDMKYPAARRCVIYWGVSVIGLVYFLVSLSGYVGWGTSLSKFQNIIDAVTESSATYGPAAYLCIYSVDVYCDTDLDLDTQGHHDVDPFVSYCLCGLLQEKKCGELHHTTFLPEDHRKFCGRVWFAVPPSLFSWRFSRAGLVRQRYALGR